MRDHNQKGFTIIELLVVITIIAILSIAAYAPYAHNMNKAKVKHTNKELSQAIYEAKNMAKNGSINHNGNISIGVYFDNSQENKNYYSVYGYNHDVAQSNIRPLQSKRIGRYILQPGIQIENFAGYDKGMVFFRSISGSGIILGGDAYQKITDNEILIDYSYKGSLNNSLKNSLKYFQDTQIIDY